MKDVKYGFSGMSVPVESEGEESLLWIFNKECERIVKYWLADEDWAKGFEHHKADYWMFQELQGLGRAIFFMDKLENVDQSRAEYIYDFCKAEVERRRNEGNA